MLREEFGKSPFRVADAIKAGASRTTLHRLVHNGELEAPARAVLQLRGGGLGMTSELAIVSVKAHHATICLNSALSFWDLTDELPASTHIAVARGTSLPQIARPRTKVHVFNADTFDLGREAATTDAHEPFWIYSPERSIVDALRMSRWIGRDVGLHALRRYLTRPGANPSELSDISRLIGGERTLAPAMEAILS